MKSNKLFILCINQRKSLKKVYYCFIKSKHLINVENHSSSNNNKLKISAPTWNDKFELPEGSYFVSDIEDYFKYILKKHGENIDNLSEKIYVNKLGYGITFRIKNGYSLELLTPGTMELLGSTENKITKDKSGKNVPHLEITK